MRLLKGQVYFVLEVQAVWFHVYEYSISYVFPHSVHVELTEVKLAKSNMVMRAFKASTTDPDGRIHKIHQPQLTLRTSQLDSYLATCNLQAPGPNTEHHLAPQRA